MSNNSTMELTGIFKFLRFIAKGFFFLIYKIEIQGEENIPEEGAVILCPNHISSWDPVILYVYIHRVIYFMTKEELFKNKLLGKILIRFCTIPVKRDGTDATAIEKRQTSRWAFFQKARRLKKISKVCLSPKRGRCCLHCRRKHRSSRLRSVVSINFAERLSIKSARRFISMNITARSMTVKSWCAFRRKRI